VCTAVHPCPYEPRPGPAAPPPPPAIAPWPPLHRRLATTDPCGRHCIRSGRQPRRRTGAATAPTEEKNRRRHRAIQDLPGSVSGGGGRIDLHAGRASGWEAGAPRLGEAPPRGGEVGEEVGGGEVGEVGAVSLQMYLHYTSVSKQVHI
jgi:hypothetical protein